MNPYYNSTFNVTPGTQVGSQRIEDQYTLIGTGFDLVKAAMDTKGAHAGQTWTGAHDFTGATPTAATLPAATNTTGLATTAHVFAERTNTATLTNKTLTAPVINSPTGLTKSDVGLSNVDNTADSAKPISTATQSALDLKAPLASPTFTGTPAVPTAAATTNTTQAASTAMVQAALAAYSGTNLGLPSWTGADALKTVRINSGGTGYEWVLSSSVTETLTNKTINSPTITGYTETVYALSGTAIDPANGTIQTKTLSTNTTFTESLADGQSVVLMLNPSTYTTTWPTTSWVNTAGSGSAPTLKASVVNVVVLWQVGGTLYGNWAGSL